MVLQHTLKLTPKRPLPWTYTHLITRPTPQRRYSPPPPAPQPHKFTPLSTQRLNRPVSPHLSVHAPNIALYGSGLNRISAVLLGGSFYLGGITYLTLYLAGHDVSTAHMVAGVAAWPAGVKIGVKSFFAAGFLYHGISGVRHMVWDLGWGFRNKTVVRTGWGVLGLTVLGTVAGVGWW